MPWASKLKANQFYNQCRTIVVATNLPVHAMPKIITTQNLPQEVKDLLLGSTLGDACLVKLSANSNTTAKFYQSILHELYLLHIRSVLVNFCSSTPV